MRIVDRLAGRMIGGGLVLVVLVSSCAAALPVPQDATPDQERQDAPATSQPPSAPRPAPPPATQAAPPSPEQLPDSPGAKQPPAADKVEGQSEATQSLPQAQPSEAQKPVGTAVAEPASTTGFAASKPAGAALAPAKQRRVRTILISVGAVVGAAVALGTVMALSKGTPSKPPGSQ